MIEQEPAAGTDAEFEEDFVEFRAAGEDAKGSFRCADCGYGVVVTGLLPSCPMCGGGVWEASPWSPFRAARL